MTISEMEIVDYFSRLSSSTPNLVTIPHTKAFPIKKALLAFETPSSLVWLSGNILRRSNSIGVSLRKRPVSSSMT